jgi:hypothetical protein
MLIAFMKDTTTKILPLETLPCGALPEFMELDQRLLKKVILGI